MADELPPAVAQFIADMSRWVKPLAQGEDDVRRWAATVEAQQAKAEESIKQSQVAQEQATRSMKDAQDQVAKLARNETDQETALRALTKAQQDQQALAGRQAQVQRDLGGVTNRNSDAYRRLANAQTHVKNTGSDATGVLQKLWMVAGFATGSLEPLAADVIAVTGGMASGLVSAGLGVGVFGLVAKGAYSQVSTALQNYTKAQQAADTATTKTARLKAIKQEKQAFDGLTGSQVKFAKAILSAENQYQSFVKKNTAGVAKILTQGIGLLPKIFGSMQQFLPPVEAGLSKVIAMMGRGLNSGWFQQFIHTMAANSGSSLEKLAVAIGNIIHGVASLLTTFAPFSQVVLKGLDQMTAGFAKWAQGLHSTTGFSEFMAMVKTQAPTIIATLKNLSSVALQFIKDMSGSASNMLWLKAIPQIAQLAATFMKANPSLVKWAMNILLITGTSKQLMGWAKSGKKAVTDFVTPFAHGATNIKHFVQGLSDADQAASKATGKWGTFGGKIKSALSAIGSGGGKALTWVKGFGSALLEDAQWAGRFAVAMGGSAWSKIKTLGSALSGASAQAGEFAANMAASAAAAARAGIAWAAAAVKAVALKVAQLAVSAATKAWAAAQAALDVIMDANPIFLVIAAVIALVAAIVYCYFHFAAFRNIVNDVGRALRTGFVAALHAVETGARAVIGWLKSNWMLILGILGGPIALAVALIFKYWRQIKTGFTDAAKFCENVAKAGFNAVRNVIGLELRGAEVTVRAFISGVKATLSWLNGLGNLFRGWWNRAVSAVQSAASRMLSVVRSIPGRIRSALGNLGSLLFSAGKSIVQGLINGIKSMVGAAGSAVSGIVSEIKNFLPFSPAKKGPLAGSGNPRYSGLSIARQLAQGIIAGHGLVTAAARQLTTGLSLTAAGGIQQGTLRTIAPAAAGGGGGGGTITVNVDGRKLFEIYQAQLYRYNIRNSGTVTGVVKPV